MTPWATNFRPPGCSICASWPKHRPFSFQTLNQEASAFKGYARTDIHVRPNVRTIFELTPPDGQITSDFQKSCQAQESEIVKNISVFIQPDSLHIIAVPLRGALAIVTNEGRGCGGR
jgi:hypothetical protein